MKHLGLHGDDFELGVGRTRSWTNGGLGIVEFVALRKTVERAEEGHLHSPVCQRHDTTVVNELCWSMLVGVQMVRLGSSWQAQAWVIDQSDARQRWAAVIEVILRAAVRIHGWKHH